MSDLMLAQVLYTWLVVVGTLDAFLVAPALGKATTAQTAGRLFSTLAVLTGLVLASSGRLFALPPLTPVVVIGLLMVDLGLTGYAFTLPDTNLLHLFRRRQQ